MIRTSSLAFWAVSLATLVSLTGCRTVTELAVIGLAEAVTGDEVDRPRGTGGPAIDAADRILDDPARPGGGTDRRTTASVYESGPTPGWERGFRTRGSVRSSYYLNSVCLNIPLELELSRLWSREAPDPFGPVERPGYEPFVEGNTQGIVPGYTRLGEVRLGGPSSTGEIWQSLRMDGMAGMNGASCPVLGIFATGRIDGEGIILR